jgi:hypothetical protein
VGEDCILVIDDSGVLALKLRKPVLATVYQPFPIGGGVCKNIKGTTTEALSPRDPYAGQLRLSALRQGSLHCPHDWPRAPVPIWRDPWIPPLDPHLVFFCTS